ncbi:hypothetical protein AB0C77_12825 [Streptomyces sp. NPDC048629]|uniref:hypothetical protein n=1 Tax=Streptomyces sp. NPDC048629 TaxID=3154824 RepID=UPI00341C9229
MWQLDTDHRAAHIGAALGYLGDDERAPTYRVGRAHYERTWRDGQWEGPEEDRPETPPDFLRAVCSCGWYARVLVEMHPDAASSRRRVPQGQDRARAFWLAHALAATSAALPDDAEQARARAMEWLRTLADSQPLAALALTRQLRADVDEIEQRAVRHARALEVPWEDIGAAVGTTRQQAWRKHKGLAPLDEKEARDVLRPTFLPSYQHDDGHPPYTVTDIDLTPLFD